MNDIINWNDDTVYNLTGLPPDGRRGMQRYRARGLMVLLFVKKILKVDEWHTCTNFIEIVEMDNE